MKHILLAFFIVVSLTDDAMGAVTSGGQMANSPSTEIEGGGTQLPQCCAQCISGPLAKCPGGSSSGGSSAARSSRSNCSDPLDLQDFGMGLPWAQACVADPLDCECKCRGELPDLCDHQYSKLVEDFVRTQERLCQALGGEPKSPFPHSTYLKGIICDFRQTGSACTQVVSQWNAAQKNCAYFLGDRMISMSPHCSGNSLRDRFRQMVQSLEQYQNGCLGLWRVNRMVRDLCEGCGRLDGLNACGPWPANVDTNNCAVNVFETPASPR